MAKNFRLDTGGKDSDGDGLSDEFEKMVLGTNPKRRDSDGDGLTDLRELDFATNPLKADTDGDGLKDNREVKLGTNPHAKDSDQDGVGDKVEVQRGTATAPDSDGDGVPDWVDAVEADWDYDGDGLTDAEEAWMRTNQYRADTDGDGTADEDEVIDLTNPRGPMMINDDGSPIIRVPSGPQGPAMPPEIRVPSGPNTDIAVPPPGPDVLQASVEVEYDAGESYAALAPEQAPSAYDEPAYASTDDMFDGLA